MKKTLTHPRGKARSETALNVGVPSILHTRIRVRAAKEGVTIKDFVTGAVEWFLNNTTEPADTSAA